MATGNNGVTIHLFTDGGCSGNPGPGGWAYVLRHLPSGKEKEASGGEPETTNNRMELEAVIQGLETLINTQHFCMERDCDNLSFSDGLKFRIF